MRSKMRLQVVWSTRACHETLIQVTSTPSSKRIAVGAGPVGLPAATTAAERGHRVTLFDAATEIGGQFNLAKRIQGRRSLTKRFVISTAS